MRNEIRLWFTQLRQLFCLHKSISFTQIDSKSSFYVCKKCGYCGELANGKPYSVLKYSLEHYDRQEIFNALVFLESNGWYKVDSIDSRNQYTHHEFYNFFTISYRTSYEKEMFDTYFKNIPRPSKEVMERRMRIQDELLSLGVTNK